MKSSRFNGASKQILLANIFHAILLSVGLLISSSAQSNQAANAIKFGTIEFGPYTSAMSLEEAQKVAGGEIECILTKGGSIRKGNDPRAEPRKITCELIAKSDKKTFSMVKGALTNETLSMEYVIKLPVGMQVKEIEAQVMEKWARFGKPPIVKKHSNIWVWVSNLNDIYRSPVNGEAIDVRPNKQRLEVNYNSNYGSPYLRSRWFDEDAKKRNKQRFDLEWAEYEKHLTDTAPKPKLDL